MRGVQTLGLSLSDLLITLLPTDVPVCRGTPCGCPILGRHETCPYMIFFALSVFSAQSVESVIQIALNPDAASGQ